MSNKNQQHGAEEQPPVANEDGVADPAIATDPTDAPPPADTADWKDRFLRAKADFANLQRRAREEQQAAVRFANADFARGLIEVLDDFERTLQAATSAEPGDVVTGVQMVYDKLQKVLRDHRVEPIVADGELFDPQMHEALLQQDSADVPAGTVLQDVRRGYRLHDRVLRPSGVIVSRRPTPDPDAGDPEPDQE